jgi:hypothetical protein
VGSQEENKSEVIGPITAEPGKIESKEENSNTEETLGSPSQDTPKGQTKRSSITNTIIEAFTWKKDNK